jgi:hypothetical protein
MNSHTERTAATSPRSVPISCTVPLDAANAIERAAHAEHISVSAWLRRAAMRELRPANAEAA